MELDSCWIQQHVTYVQTTFKLLPHSLERTSITLNKTHITIPDVENMLRDNEKDLLQTHLSEHVDLREVDAVIERGVSTCSTAGLDVNRFFTLTGKVSKPNRSNWSWIVRLLGFLTIPVLTIKIYCLLTKQNVKRFWEKLCVCSSSQDSWPTTFINQELSDIKVFTAEKQTISMSAGETREVQQAESETETETTYTYRSARAGGRWRCLYSATPRPTPPEIQNCRDRRHSSNGIHFLREAPRRPAILTEL